MLFFTGYMLTFSGNNKYVPGFQAYPCFLIKLTTERIPSLLMIKIFKCLVMEYICQDIRAQKKEAYY